MMKKFKIVYAAIGVILAVSVVATGNYGLSKTNQEIYDTAMELQEQMQETGFAGFGVDDKKIRFYDGTVDYVVFGNEVEKEEAAFDTFVGTTSKIDGEYQVILPTYENFSDMFSLLGAAQSVADGNMQFSEENYSTSAHVATLWHEAFHAWQFTNWEEEIMEQPKAAGMTEQDNLQECSLEKKGEMILLTKTEYKILELLMKSPGRVYTKQQIFDYAWEDVYLGDDSTLMVHISNLRNKIEDDPKNPGMIKTVKGLGYKFEKEG